LAHPVYRINDVVAATVAMVKSMFISGRRLRWLTTECVQSAVDATDHTQRLTVVSFSSQCHFNLLPVGLKTITHWQVFRRFWRIGTCLVIRNFVYFSLCFFLHNKTSSIFPFYSFTWRTDDSVALQWKNVKRTTKVHLELKEMRKKKCVHQASSAAGERQKRQCKTGLDGDKWFLSGRWSTGDENASI